MLDATSPLRLPSDNIHICHNDKNMGPAYSRNIGIKKSVGEYIAFLDSDDDWHPQKLQIQIELMKLYKVQLSGTAHKAINKNDLQYEKSINYINRLNLPIKRFEWPNILFSSPFATPSVVMHSSLKNYLFDENLRYCEDYDLWLRISYFTGCIKILLPLTYTFKHDYISNSGSLSSNLFAMQIGVEQIYLGLINNPNIKKYKAYLFYALYFSKIKYFRRIVKSILAKLKSKFKI
ncbi:glycosyltransferase, family 2 [Campylobacter iguaniorum]|uniref:glycosyltransferase n=1 Tax=Campylobacter iguaniorum TaxID=1244531 RepID=UPI0007C9567D|nr:glycosyltransferase [Campylobacter iguaniorum]ANE35135.1 glycosyltransferase, family 2 [Campylobacter iguaniorum]